MLIGGLEEIVVRREDPGIDLSFFVPSTPVHGRSYIVVDPVPRHSGENP